VGNMTGSACLKKTVTRTNTTTTMTNMTTRRMGRCHAGEQTTGRTQLQRLQCCPRAIRWGRGVEDVDCRPPHHRHHRQQQQLPPRRGGIVPPHPVCPVPPDAAHHCQCLWPRSTAAARGLLGRGRTCGGGGGGPRLCTSLSDPTWGGQWE
jgi:hypothetical protein